MKFKGKIAKLGDRRIIEVGKSIRDFFKPGDEVIVFKKKRLKKKRWKL